MEKIKVITADAIPDEYVKKVAAYAEGIEFVFCKSQAELDEKVGDCDVIYGNFSQKTLQAAKKLRWIQLNRAGVEEILFPELVASDVILTNMAGIFAPQVSEHALALMLAFTRGIHRFLRLQAQREWKRLTDLGELEGATVGIVGLGEIGTETARRAYYGFGMRVLAVDIEPCHKPYFVAELNHLSGLLQMASQVDFLVSAAPHTRRTEKMFDERVFGAMCKTAYFVNVSRGKLVDEPSLIRALEEGRIAGAGLDVTYEEPLPKASALWALPNVIITGHSASQSPYYRTRCYELFAENLRRFLTREPLLNVVDKEKGY